ncbi:hypothetical protein P691DRAFT_805352 [Macrolepiota fuliginosa MF-IS2]|uniref:Uncharacterized protein n=1 Tax=Macrolepiota fuliginosa MF-IS2 TaxID=1400762 RepID=A0A9P5XK15_9AGAR|nr:hypothetical protein P691DRAFT_805352 [Macrolepiota fuliginosa MF-IS2]
MAGSAEGMVIAISNLVQVTVVTADDTVYIVNGHENGHLFWGVGWYTGSNFGVVTDFIFDVMNNAARALYDLVVFTNV